MPKSLRDFLTVAEVAERYGVSTYKVYRLINQGRLSAQKLQGIWLLSVEGLPAQLPVREYERALPVSLRH